MPEQQRVRKLSIAALNNSVGYHPHQAQRYIHQAKRDSRFRVVCAGRRTGKSTLGGHELFHEAIRAKFRTELEPNGRRAEFWIVGPEYSDAEKEFRVLYNDLTKFGAEFDRPGTYYNAVNGDMHISLFGGRYLVHAKSAKYPDTLVGEGLEGVILAEAAKLKPNVWTKYIRPTLADYRGWALLSSTPEGKNWFYDQWMRGQVQKNDDEGNWWSIRMPSWSNDVVFPLGRTDPEIIDMAADMSEEKFKQEIGAEFTEFVGRVFKRFTEEDNVGKHPYNPRWPVYLATDYGFTNPNVALFVQVDVWDNVWVCAEYYQRNRTSEEFARDLFEDPKLGALARAARNLYPDPEDPGASRTLADKFHLNIMDSTGGELRERLNLIRKWLMPQPFELEDGHPEKLPKLFVDASCTNTIREMNDYRYPETKGEEGSTQEEKEKPLKADDHAPEALGRFFGGHFGKVIKQNERARVSQGKMRRR
jgi:hypothetical protein